MQGDSLAARKWQDLAGKVVAIEVKAYKVLLADGFQMPCQPLPSDDIHRTLAKDAECLRAAKAWAEDEKSNKTIHEAAVNVLTAARQLREAFLLSEDGPANSLNRTVEIASGAACLGSADMLFELTRDGLIKEAVKWVDLQMRQGEGRRKGAANRGGWHEMAFHLFAAQRIAAPDMAHKTLLGWTVDRMNESHLKDDQKPITEDALEQALRRKKPLFEALLADHRKEFAALEHQPLDDAAATELSRRS